MVVPSNSVIPKHKAHVDAFAVALSAVDTCFLLSLVTSGAVCDGTFTAHSSAAGLGTDEISGVPLQLEVTTKSSTKHTY